MCSYASPGDGVSRARSAAREDIRESSCFLGGRLRMRTVLVGSAVSEPDFWGFGPDAGPPAQEANVQRVLDEIPVDVLRIVMRLGAGGDFEYEMSDDVRAAVAARRATIAPDVAANPVRMQRFAVYDVELELRCLDASGRACSLSTSAVSFIQLAAASLAKCSIQAVIDSFDIDVCAVGMLPRGFGEVEYVVAPEVEQAIRSKTMRLRPQHNTTPGRVEKYQSRGFTLLE